MIDNSSTQCPRPEWTSTWWQRASQSRGTQFATGIVDRTSGRPARLPDIVPGRTARMYADWLASQDRGWRETIAVAALDPFRGFATALTAQPPDATHVLEGTS